MRTLSWREVLPKPKDKDWQNALSNGTDRLKLLREQIVARGIYPTVGKQYTIHELADLWQVDVRDARIIVAGIHRHGDVELSKPARVWMYTFPRVLDASAIHQRQRGGARRTSQIPLVTESVRLGMCKNPRCKSPARNGFCGNTCREEYKNILLKAGQTAPPAKK